MDFLGYPTFLHLIARGPSYSTALQGQVVIKEGANILTEAQSGASFRHGPFEVVDANHRALVCAPKGNTSDVTFNLVRDMTAAGGKVLMITNITPPEPINNAYIYELPEVPEYLFPMLDIIPVEGLLILSARRQGVAPGILTKGNKVTVVE